MPAASAAVLSDQPSSSIRMTRSLRLFGQVRAFLARHTEDAERCPLPQPLTDGALLPDAEHDGFFYALLRKT